MNPFDGLGGIIPAARVKGRRIETGELIAALGDSTQNISLVGEPRIGKSSLAAAVVGMMPPASDRAVVRISMSDYGAAHQFFSDLAEQTIDSWERLGHPRNELVERIGCPKPSDDYEAYRVCRRILKALRNAGARILWVIDEFDKVVYLPECRETVLRFRELIYHYEAYGTSALIISRRTIEHLEERLNGVSNLRGVLAHVTFLRTLDMQGMNEIVDRCLPDWELSQTERDELWALTGGHPFLTELVLYYGWSMRSIYIGAQRSRLQILQYYGDLRHQHEEDGLFQPLVQLAVGPRWSVSEDHVERLVSFGVIVNAKSGHRAFSEHYQQYLERCSREGATMDLWRETEVAVRDFVEATGMKHFGTEWEEATVSGRPDLKTFFESARDLQARDVRSFGNCSPRLLDYFYPMELWEIISAHWKVFAAYFPVPGRQGAAQRQYWRDRFEVFAKVRTPKMHHRDHVVSHSEATMASAFCQQILDRIREIQSEESVPRG